MDSQSRPLVGLEQSSGQLSDTIRSAQDKTNEEPKLADASAEMVGCWAVDHMDLVEVMKDNLRDSAAGRKDFHSNCDWGAGSAQR